MTHQPNIKVSKELKALALQWWREYENEHERPYFTAGLAYIANRAAQVQRVQ